MKLKQILSPLKSKILDFLEDKEAKEEIFTKRSGISDTFLDCNYFSDLLSIRLHLEEKGLFESESSFGFALEICPLISAGQNTQEEVHQLIKEISKEQASLQFILFADPFLDPIFDNWVLPRSQREPIFHTIAQRKIQFFKDEILSRDPKMPVPLRNFRIFFSYTLPKGPKDQYESTFRTLNKFKKISLQTFSRITHARSMSPQELVQVLSLLTSFNQTTKPPGPQALNPDGFLHEDVGSGGGGGITRVLPQSILFEGPSGATFFQSLQAHSQPRDWLLPYNTELIGDFMSPSYRISCPFYIHYGIRVVNQSLQETKLKAKASLLRQQFKIAGIFRKNPKICEEAQEHDRACQALLEGEKFVRTRFNVGVYGTVEKLPEAVSTVKALYKKHGYELHPTYGFQLQDLIENLPLAWGEMHDLKSLKKTRQSKITLTSEPSVFTPLVGEWQGNSTDGMPLIGRRGQIAFWDPFVSESNYNGVIVGQPGSGKSVFVQELVQSQLSLGTRVFVLDLGRSFEKLCHSLDGQHVFFTKESNLNLNPFSFIRTDADLESIDESLNMVSNIVCTMAKPTEKIDGERANIIAKCVRKVWQDKGNKALIDDIITLLSSLKYSSELMRGATESLIDCLHKYSSTGEYKKFFYGDKEVSFQNPFVVIETEELKAYADLQAVVLQIFSLKISSEIFTGSRDKKTAVVIEEAWNTLSSPQMGPFYGGLARRLRKYGASLFVVTQGLRDFETSPGAQAVFKNSSWLVLLGRNQDNINYLREHKILDLDNGAEDLLSSLNKEDAYAEAFILDKGSGTFSLSQLRLDPFSLMMYSSKPEDSTPILILKDKGFSISDAVDWLLNHKKAVLALKESGLSFEDAVETLLERTPKQQEQL